MGSSGSKLDSFLTINQLVSLLQEVSTTAPSITVTVTASHINKENVEETVSKKVVRGKHIKNKETGMVLAVSKTGQVVLEQESIALGQCWEWDGIGIGKNLRNKAHNGVLDVVDGTNLGLRERDPFSKMQEWRKEGNYLSCDMFWNKVLDAYPEEKPIYWDKHDGMNQQWEFTDYSYWNKFLIQNRTTKSLLGVFRNPGSGAQEIRMTSNTHEDSHEWSWQGQSQLKNQATGLVLDFFGHGQVGVYQSHGGPNQQWTHSKEGWLECQDAGQILDLDQWGQVVMSQPHGGSKLKWDLKPVTRIKVVKKRIETFKKEHALQVFSSNDISKNVSLPVFSANVPILKVTASLEVRPGDSTSSQSLQQFQKNLKQKFYQKDDTVETSVKFSLSPNSFPIQFEANNEMKIKVYDPRFEEQAKGGLFKSPKETSIHLNIIKTFIVLPVLVESASMLPPTAHYQPPQTGYTAASGYPSAHPGYSPMYAGIPPASGGYPNASGSYQPATGGYPTTNGGDPNASGGYPPATVGYPPATGGYPTATGGNSNAFGGYPPVTGGYPPVTGGYPPATQAYPPATGVYPSTHSGFPPAYSVEPPLPAGWEERTTQTGRPYFINHASKATQWERPHINQ